MTDLALHRADLLLVPLRVLLSVAVTLHVLRTKRDIGASIGWIGLCWLAPVSGSILYVMFGVNRVRRLARRLSRRRPWAGGRGFHTVRRELDSPFDLLSEAVGRLTGRPLLDGNAIRAFHDGDQAYPVMLDAIESARSTILLCSYILRGDKVGGRFVDALSAAAERGVSIRVIVDGIGSGYFRCPVARRLRARGVPTVRFMHSVWPWRMPFINLRTHKKILVVDGLLGFTGGMNIGGENVLRIRPRHPVSDTHFELRGPVVHQLSEAFARDWAFTTGEDLDHALFFPEQQAAGSALMRVVTSGPDAEIEKIEFAIMQGVAMARRSIRLMTPYFLPDERLLTVLAMAAMRGVEIDIVVPEHSNHRLVDWARDANNGPLLEAGARIWLAKPPFNHSKLMVVDERWSLIGSANLDVRSLRLNFELNVEVYDPESAKTLDAFICEHRHGRLTHHDLDKRRFPRRLRDQAARLMLPYL